ncbi:thioredoxin-like protein [Pisolithus orientalis]|uniref:thioredoxin-like protein n=1 Tax=Pisolithus orientalis TaxID=936130 RepID=UPI0022240276|nr:thioredoxin-like protein [Pisolithus orientalis]KAI6019886.1 thioredoxin-like protein [Pisolithus orientalis]
MGAFHSVSNFRELCGLVIACVGVLSSSVSSLSRNALSVSWRTPAFRRFLSDEARAKIHAAVNEHPVVLFMKGTAEMPQCGFSRAVIQVLDMHRVPSKKLRTYNVLEDPELRGGIKEFSDWPTIPQLYVNGQFVGGCDILLSMHQSGELEALLEKHDIIPKIESSSQS